MVTVRRYICLKQNSQCATVAPGTDQILKFWEDKLKFIKNVWVRKDAKPFILQKWPSIQMVNCTLVIPSTKAVGKLSSWKYKTMTGHYTHTSLVGIHFGLPIEHAVIKNTWCNRLEMAQ